MGMIFCLKSKHFIYSPKILGLSSLFLIIKWHVQDYNYLKVEAIFDLKNYIWITCEENINSFNHSFFHSFNVYVLD